MDKIKNKGPQVRRFLEAFVCNHLFHSCPKHVDFLNKQGSCGRKQVIFPLDQYTMGGVLRSDGNKK